MSHYYFRNVNEAFTGMVHRFKDIHALNNGDVIATPSRYGDVLQYAAPVTITYYKPTERVLFNQSRDCNPFFHLFESLWMLAGRNDVEPLAYFNSKMREFSDDGKVYHGAYGHRWQHFPDSPYWSNDQLEMVIDLLKRQPTSRRVVMSMWSPRCDLTPQFDPGMYYQPTGKDYPCNTHIYFLIRNFQDDRVLDMTVCNRSNDMIWGMFGANVVHMSFLQEYIACSLGIEVGRYHQFTNNLHIYTERWTPDKWLQDNTPDYSLDPHFLPTPLFGSPEDRSDFDIDCKEFINSFRTDPNRAYNSFFIEHIAKPMAIAFINHREKTGIEFDASTIYDPTWAKACELWLHKRKAKNDPA